MSSDKYKQIMLAALELFVDKGFHGTSMAMIADRAKVGAGTIYRYFESKDTLIIALFQDVEKKIQQALQKDSSDTKSIREHFLELGESLLRYLIHNPMHFSYIEQFLNSPYGVKYRHDMILGHKKENKLFLDLFEKGVEQGQLKDLPIAVLCALTFGPIASLARDHNLGLFSLDNALISQTIHACWDGIKE